MNGAPACPAGSAAPVSGCQILVLQEKPPLYIFSGSGYSTPKVSAVMLRILCSASGRSE